MLSSNPTLHTLPNKSASLYGLLSEHREEDEAIDESIIGCSGRRTVIGTCPHVDFMTDRRLVELVDVVDGANLEGTRSSCCLENACFLYLISCRNGLICRGLETTVQGRRSKCMLECIVGDFHCFG